jgi:HD-like signal output (HDOD) protein
MTATAKQGPAGVPWELLTLPAFPSVSTKALQLLNGSDTRLLELYQLMAADPSFSSEVLRIANSPLFALPSAVRNLSQATMLLGFERLKGVAVTIGIRSYLRDLLAIPALQACWRHSLACAMIAEEATSTTSMRCDDGYTAGILHDLGRIALAAIRPTEYAKLLQETPEKPCDFRQRERDLFGIDHCEAGKSLVAAWKLPQDLVAITSRHHDEVSVVKEFDLAAVVHYSCRFADALGFHAVKPNPAVSYESLLREVPVKHRPMFTFEPRSMALTIGARIEALVAV